MSPFWVVALVLAPILLVGAGIALAQHHRERHGEELSRWRRLAAWMVSGPFALGTAFEHMARVLPRYWSEHPESKHPRHPDRWPPR